MARQRFGSQNRKRLACLDGFLKFKPAKFAPRSNASAFWKSKSKKYSGVGALFEVQAGKICSTMWRESDLEVKSVKDLHKLAASDDFLKFKPANFAPRCGARSQNRKNWRCRSIFSSSRRQNLHHAVARERFGSQNRKRLACLDDFLKFKSAKFAPRCGQRTMWKSKSLTRQVLGAFFEVQSALRVAGASIFDAAST